MAAKEVKFSIEARNKMLRIVEMRVVGATKVEVKERKDRLDDALHATRAAVEEGILFGGGVALVRAAEALKKVRTHNDDQKTGVDIVRRALSWPARQLAINAGEDGSVNGPSCLV
jgi:chaperonin GroEL